MQAVPEAVRDDARTCLFRLDRNLASTSAIDIDGVRFTPTVIRLPAPPGAAAGTPSAVLVLAQTIASAGGLAQANGSKNAEQQYLLAYDVQKTIAGAREHQALRIPFHSVC